jgi:hypothetical protein
LAPGPIFLIVSETGGVFVFADDAGLPAWHRSLPRLSTIEACRSPLSWWLDRRAAPAREPATR